MREGGREGRESGTEGRSEGREIYLYNMYIQCICNTYCKRKKTLKE